MEAIFKSALLLAIAYIIFRITLRNHTSYRQQRIFLLSSALVSMILPFIPKVFSASQIINSIQIAEIQVGSNSVINMSVNNKLLTNYLSIFYTVGLVVLSLFYIYLTFRILRKGLQNRSKHGKYFLVINESISAPFSFWKSIYLPKNLNDEEVRNAIIEHETAHLRNSHSIDILLLTIIATAQWFNPFAWMYLKTIKEIHEYEADAATISSGVAIDEYCKQMISQTFEIQTHILVNNFNKSLTLKRLAMLTQKKTFKYAKQIAVATFVTVLIVGIFISLVRCGKEAGEEQVLKLNKIYFKHESGASIVVDQNAIFNGGDINSFRNYVMENLEYPQSAKDKKAEGKVIIEFIVDAEGKIDNVKVLRSSGNSELDIAALTVISNSPRWIPAKIDNKNVAQAMVIPVVFKL